ncbi:MAG: sulfate adenylyltransferase [bacterium]
MSSIHQDPVQAHGGRLVDRFLPESEQEIWEDKQDELPSIKLDFRQASDLEMIGNGAFSPIEGFMGAEDHQSVVHEMKLSDGTPWPIPITLSVTEEKSDELPEEGAVALEDEQGNLLAVFHLKERHRIDKEIHAEKVFKTKEDAHPGVDNIYEAGGVALGGPVDVIQPPTDTRFDEYRLTPRETRERFQELGWDSVVGFQTRNPMHRAHEYLAKCALENVDGLLIHPLVGDTKEGDVPAEVRMSCYQTLIDNYFPDDRVELSVMPAKMNYAGPREAILHALIRKNYGCTDFIVGRDHAGVGDYYGTYEAQEVFSDFEDGELGINPVFFDYAFWCEVCGNMASQKTCPHDAEDQIYLSGTKVREKLRNGESLPSEFSRPEVAEILREAYSGAGSPA